jgi:hypothetical protein
VTLIGVRPFIKIRSVNSELDYPKVQYFGDLVNGPWQYNPKAYNHQLLANAYYSGGLGIVSKASIDLNYLPV